MLYFTLSHQHFSVHVRKGGARWARGIAACRLHHKNQDIQACGGRIRPPFILKGSRRFSKRILHCLAAVFQKALFSCLVVLAVKGEKLWPVKTIIPLVKNTLYAIFAVCLSDGIRMVSTVTVVKKYRHSKLLLIHAYILLRCNS